MNIEQVEVRRKAFAETRITTHPKPTLADGEVLARVGDVMDIQHVSGAAAVAQAFERLVHNNVPANIGIIARVDG